MQAKPQSQMTLAIALIAACIVAALLYHFTFAAHSEKKPETASAPASDAAPDNSVELSENQLKTFRIEPAVTHRFRTEKEAVGNIVYHEKDIGDNNAPASSTSKFLVANIRESDSPLIHVGEIVRATLAAYPDHVFTGKITTLGVTVYDSGGNPAIDPNTHRITARCEMQDPKDELYPGMLANVTIEIDHPVDSIAVPQNGIVREGDGTMTAWVTHDQKHFEKRTVKIGLQEDGYDQILEGISPNEMVVTDNAVLLSNMNNGDSEPQ